MAEFLALYHWPLIRSTEDTWRKVESGSGLLINEQLFRRFDLKLGDALSFKTYSGTLNLRISGVYSDYGNPKGQIMLPLNLFRKHFPDIPSLRYAISTTEPTASSLANSLTKQFSLSINQITNQSEIKNFSQRIFRQTFEVTTALSYLTLAIAGVAMFTSISTLSDIRIGQLGSLWVLGLSRKKLLKIELFRALILTSIIFLFSIPVGISVLFVINNSINVSAFGWQLPTYYFPYQWLNLFIVSLIATVISNFVHCMKIYQSSPADLLRLFQYDR